jgi:hypothetical protein
MAKYIDMQYAAPAVVSVSFTVKSDEWNALDDEGKAKYVRDELIHANSVMAENEGTSSFITDTDIILDRLEQDDEYEFNGDGDE